MYELEKSVRDKIVMENRSDREILFEQAKKSRQKDDEDNECSILEGMTISYHDSSPNLQNNICDEYSTNVEEDIGTPELCSGTNPSSNVVVYEHSQNIDRKIILSHKNLVECNLPSLSKSASMSDEVNFSLKDKSFSKQEDQANICDSDQLNIKQNAPQTQDIDCTQNDEIYHVSTTSVNNEKFSLDSESALKMSLTTLNQQKSLPSIRQPGQAYTKLTDKKVSKFFYDEPKVHLESDVAISHPTNDALDDVFPNFSCIFTEFLLLGRRNNLKDTTENNLKINMERFQEILDFQHKSHLEILTFIEDQKNSQAIEDGIQASCTGGSLYDKPLTPTPLDKPQLIPPFRFYKVVSTREEIDGIISAALTRNVPNHFNWKALPQNMGIESSWNLLWTWKRPCIDTHKLLSFQKISRFFKTSGLTRKDLLKKSLQRFCSGSERKVMPLTFSLPKEYNAFAAAFSSLQRITGLNETNIWIMKPIGMSRGRGITLFNDIGKVSYSRPVVIQKYLTNPFLFDGYKFDLRLYVLVTSFNPLEAFLYKEGFARFGTCKFSAKANLLQDNKIHLTNSSIQKQYCDEMERYHPVRLAGVYGGDNKVKMTWLWEKMNERGIDTKSIWKRICDVCLLTLLSVNNEIPYQPNSFEVFGFDVIIDESLKPWLIEVNACPSLELDSSIDDVKIDMIRDTITLVNPQHYDRSEFVSVCKRHIDYLETNKSNVSRRYNGIDKEKGDISCIFKNNCPRQYGELPPLDHMGAYQRLAPRSKLSYPTR